MTLDAGKPDLTAPQSWNRYSYVQGDPINNNDPDGRLMGNVSFDGACDPLYLDPIGMSACLIGSNTTIASVSPTMQARALFDPLTDIIDDWDYANQSGSKFNITVSSDTVNSLQSSGTLVLPTQARSQQVQRQFGKSAGRLLV
jgi:hypothetical protein